MSARVLRWLPLPILAAGLLAAWGLARGRPVLPEVAAPPPAARVEVLEVRPGPHRVIVTTHGSVEPRTEIDLVAEVPGRVARVARAFAAGAFFEADQVLLELDRGDAELALERADASRQRRASELELARARLQRLRSLAARQVASPAQIEEAEQRWQVARAALREARAVRDQALRDLERSRVRAPFAGRVRSRQVGVGQYVARGAALGRVYAVDYAEVRLPVPSAELAYLDLPLAGGEVFGPAPAVRLRAVFAGRAASWAARLVRVEAEIAPRSRMLHLVARVDDPYGRRDPKPGAPLTAGLFVEAEIEGRLLEGVTLLPRTALRGDSELLVVEPSGSVRARRVEVLRIDADAVAVGDGLAAGEQVVASALGVLEGTRVRAEPIGPSGPEPGSAP